MLKIKKKKLNGEILDLSFFIFLFFVYLYVLRSSAMASFSRGTEKVTFNCPIGQEMLNLETNCCKLLKVNQAAKRAISSTDYKGLLTSVLPWDKVSVLLHHASN